MAVLCKRCGQPNPADASYCYLDGSPLLSSQVHGPLNLAQALFAEPFHFPTGEVCQNFDQLALTCQLHWQEARELLRNGVLEAFLGRAGRNDLMRVTREAAVHADPDRGVDYFLSRLPTCNLMPPRLHLDPVPQQLGTLRPGQDRQFAVKLANHGHRLITGSIASDCPWLEIDGASPDRPRLLQFPHEQTVIVRVAGNKLMASQKPLAGKLIVATNAGHCEIPIGCEVPIQPFPHGTMQGCRTPRELAQKAKHALDEAAELFYGGAVKQWYAANGWVYPVEGEPASGKAAVQQYFEALGLTTPPRVVLDTPAVGFQGPPGQRLMQSIELHSDEKRPIFAFGRSLCPWLTVVSSVAHGNRAVIAIEATVPNTALTRLEGQVEVRSNGNQRFRVQVVLHVDAAGDSASILPTPSAAPPLPQPAPAATGGCLPKALLGCAALLLLLIVGASGGLLYLLRPDLMPFGTSPLRAYATVVTPKTCAVVEVNLEALGRTPKLEKETTQLHAQLAVFMRDLDVQNADARPQRLFVALEPDGTPLLVWTFAKPVKLGEVTPGRYEGQQDKGAPLLVDRFGPGLAWAVDGRGRLLQGTREGVRGALERGKSGKTAATVVGLARAATGVSPEALAWAAGDLGAVPAPAVAALLGGGPPLQVRAFQMELVAEAPERHILRARGTFPSERAALAGREALRQGLPGNAIPFVPAAFDLNKYVLGAATWDAQGAELHAKVPLHPTTTNALVQVAALDVKEANAQVQVAVDERYKALLEPGIAAEKTGQHGQAANDFERVVLLFPKRPDAKLRAQRAAEAGKEQDRYRAKLSAAREAIEQGNLDMARATLERLKKSRFADGQVATLEKDIAANAHRAEARALVKQAEAVLESNLGFAEQRLQAAAKLEPGNRETAEALAAVKVLHAAQQALLAGDEQLRDQRPDLAQPTLSKGLIPLLPDAKLPAWRSPAFQAGCAHWRAEAGRLCRKASEALQAAATTAQQNGERLVSQDPGAALDEYETALTRLSQAKTVLGDLQRIKGEKALAPEVRALDAQAFELQQGKKKVGGLALLAKGNKLLEQARTAAAEARRDPGTVAAATAALETALKCFHEAEQLNQPAAAKQVRLAEELKQRLDHLVHPLALEPAQDLARADWKYVKDRWTFKEADGKVYLQAQPGEAAVLESTSRDWPIEFELTLEFAIVDAGGKVYNRLFSSQADPLTLVLHHANGTTTTIALGKDSVNQFQQFARLQYNREQHTVENLIAPKAPLRLVLRCKAGDDQPKLAVLLDGKVVCTRPFPHEVEGLRLRIAPPTTSQPRFVAIYGLDVSWLGAKDKAP